MFTYAGIKTSKLNNYKSNAEIILLPVLFLWIGLVLGISFIEAPLKFQVPGVTLKIGLGIGKLVFQNFNKIEIILSLFSIIPIIFLYKKNKTGVVIMCFV
jgi:hypothetical protein